MMMRYALTSRL